MLWKRRTGCEVLIMKTLATLQARVCCRGQTSKEAYRHDGAALVLDTVEVDGMCSVSSIIIEGVWLVGLDLRDLRGLVVKGRAGVIRTCLISVIIITPGGIALIPCFSIPTFPQERVCVCATCPVQQRVSHPYRSRAVVVLLLLFLHPHIVVEAFVMFQSSDIGEACTTTSATGLGDDLVFYISSTLDATD